MSPTVKVIVEAIRAEIPGIVIGEQHMGHTVGVMNPETQRAVWISRGIIARPERGEAGGYWEADPSSVPAIVARLRVAAQVASSGTFENEYDTNLAQPASDADKSQDNNSEVDGSGQA